MESTAEVKVEAPAGGVVIGLDPQSNCYYYLHSGPIDGNFYAFKQEDQPIISNPEPVVPLYSLDPPKIKNSANEVEDIETENENKEPRFETVLIVEDKKKRRRLQMEDYQAEESVLKKINLRPNEIKSELNIFEIICPICVPKKIFDNSVALTNHLNFAHLLTGIPDSSELERRKDKEVKKPNYAYTRNWPEPKKKLTKLPLEVTSTFEKCTNIKFPHTSRWNFTNNEYYIIEEELENYICPECSENKLFSTIEAAKNHLKFAHMHQDVKNSEIVTLRDYLRSYFSQLDDNSEEDYTVLTIGKADGTNQRILTPQLLN